MQAFVDVAVLVTAVRAFAIGRAALRYGERLVTHRATLRLLARLRASTFAALEPRAPAVLGSTPDGDVLARFGADVDTIDGFYLRGLVPPLAALVAGIAWSVGLALIDATLAAIAAAGLVLGGVVLPPLVQIAARAPAGGRSPRGQVSTAAAADDLAGTPSWLRSGCEQGFLARRAAASHELTRADGRLALVRGVSEASVGLVAALAALLVTVAAIPLIRGNRIEGVVLAALPLAVLAGFEGVALLPGALERRAAARASAARVFALVDAPIAVVDPPDPAAVPSRSRHRVRRRDLRATGPRRLRSSGTARSGSRPAAAWRSRRQAAPASRRLANLLVRFWTPKSGRVEIGGVDVTTCRADDIRALIGVVPQHPYLFNGTLRDNLLVARGEADDEAIQDVLISAGLGPIPGLIDRGSRHPGGRGRPSTQRRSAPAGRDRAAAPEGRPDRHPRRGDGPPRRANGSGRRRDAGRVAARAGPRSSSPTVRACLDWQSPGSRCRNDRVGVPRAATTESADGRH